MHLDFLSSLRVVDDPLQIENDYFRQFVQIGAFIDRLDFFVALFAEVVRYLLFLYKFT